MRGAARSVTAVALAALAVFGTSSAAWAQIPTADFGSVAVGAKSADQTFTASSVGAAGTPDLVGADATHFRIRNVSCSPLPYAGALITECAIAVGFEPTAVGARQASLTFRGSLASATTTTVANLTGTGTPALVAAVTVDPTRVSFGAHTIGADAPVRTVKVTSTGTLPLRISRVRTEGDDFGVDGSKCLGRALGPQESCDAVVRFRPRAAGVRTARLVFEDNTPQGTQAVALEGTGVAAVTGVNVSPRTLGFDPTTLGSTAGSLAVRITNVGRQPVTFQTATLDGDHARDFRRVTGAAGGCQDGAPLPADSACEVRVEFQPTAAGARTAAMTLLFAGVDPQRVEFFGQGTDPSRPTSTMRPPVTAAPGDVALAVNPSEARPGSQAIVMGAGYQGETRFYWDTRAESTLIASTRADAHGHIEIPVDVPANAALGRHVIIGCDETDRCEEAFLRLIADETPALPSWAVGLAAIALVLVGAGAAAASARRRRSGSGGGDGRSGRGGNGSEGDGDGGGPGRRERAVMTGFSSAADPMTPLDEAQPLAAGQPYHFWLELGPPVVAAGADPLQLNVVVFGYDGEFAIESSVGELELAPDGTASVVYQGGVHREGMVRTPGGGGRLLFPVRAPDAPGRHRIRCSVYHRQVLVQSWVISATVDSPSQRPPATPGELGVRRERDYVLARTLDPAHLDRLAPHTLSVMLNANGDGSHSLRLFGEGAYEATTNFDASTLETLISKLRGVLEEVACERTPGRPLRYRYDGPLDAARLGDDLIRLARRGWRTYIALVNQLAGGAPGSDPVARRRLSQLLRAPGRIQVANKQNATQVVPAAFFYDHPLDTDLPQLELCAEFVEALRGDDPLEVSACFRGACPSYGLDHIVCPSGFWGYRHVIGMPQSLGQHDGAPLDASFEAGGAVDPGGAAITAGVSTDPGFTRRPAHQAALRALDPNRPWYFLDSRASVLAALQRSQPPLVYFYCHGGTDDGTAFIQVGPPNEVIITGDVFPAKDIVWDRSHPLVFVNGCHTGAVGPETPVELVSALVAHAQAVGVIGTQVTVFEPLACAFAETLLRSLLVDGDAVGAAVRRARLSLLKQGNPLGLVYIPFVSDEVRIAPSAVGSAVPAVSAGASWRA